VGHARARGDLRPGVPRVAARVAAAPRVATRASTPSGVHVHDVAGATDVARATATAAALTQGPSRQVGARAAVTARGPAGASLASAVGASAHLAVLAGCTDVDRHRGPGVDLEEALQAR